MEPLKQKSEHSKVDFEVLYHDDKYLRKHKLNKIYKNTNAVDIT